MLAALGLPAPTAAEHTGVFVLSAPPHAAIHLGGEGKLGGEGLDRVAGFWRAIGLTPPPDADQLGVLLMLYAELADAEAAARTERDQGAADARPRDPASRASMVMGSGLPDRRQPRCRAGAGRMG